MPFIAFAPLLNARARIEESAKAFDAAEKSHAGGSALAPEAQKSLDRVLMDAERALTRTEGLPRRPWFVHQVYAPGFYTGYGVKTLPAVREAIEQRDWAQAEDEVKVVAKVLDGYAAQIDRATAIVSGGAPASGR